MTVKGAPPAPEVAAAHSSLAQNLRSLALPQRLRILELLRKGQRTIEELTAILDLSRQQVSRHLRALVDAGLVTSSADGSRGNRRVYRVDPHGLRDLNSRYLRLLGHSDLPPESSSPQGQSQWEWEPPAPSLAPPPEACQTCQYSYYVHGLLENIERQLEESRESQAQLRRMSSQVLTAHEEERKRIARELHDDTAQALTSLLVRLRLLERAADLEEAKANLGQLRDLVASTLEGVRRLALDLRPSALDDLGLVPALQWYTDAFGQRWGIEARFQAAGLRRRLPAELELVLYRVAQEALTNVAKHARARRVSVILERQGRQVRLTVEDDGRGFDVGRAMSSKERGLGLFGMQERLALVGGKLDIESQPERGTKVVAEAPLRHPSPSSGG